MARSAYIYLVLDSNDNPVAAFTVKRECVTWLFRRKMREVIKITNWHVVRMLDGVDKNLYELTELGSAGEFLEREAT